MEKTATGSLNSKRLDRSYASGSEGTCPTLTNVVIAQEERSRPFESRFQRLDI
ncbi:MAG: hypothetical protein NDI61_12230 [Bdellovibrionaceae bacterium]|nr:hypothetical protein [Pseudobdellovibrionaceae bacterium]